MLFATEGCCCWKMQTAIGVLVKVSCVSIYNAKSLFKCGADARGGSPDNNMSNNNECTYSCIATRWLWNWLNSRPLKSENLNSEHASISHAKTIILHFKFGTVNTSSMKVKAFSAASSPERTRKDRHLELLFLMIGISIALAFGKN